MLIRKNTRVFKTIQQIIGTIKERPDRQKLLRLYITKAGHSIDDRISIEGLQGDSDLFYEINYDAVWNNLASSDRQLHLSDKIPGIYFFHTASNKDWDETPFEFDEKTMKEEFASLKDLPALRKKQKVEKFIFQTNKIQTKKETVRTKGVVVKDKKNDQPNYKLRQKILFTDLDTLVFRTPTLRKRDVLDYYNKIADQMLPYLKNRPVSIQLEDKKFETLDELSEHVEVPEWIETITEGKDHDRKLLLCCDKEHLLWYVEMGCVEFGCSNSQATSPDFADYIVLQIESSEAENIVAVTMVAHTILTGLQLISFLKTDGESRLHLYIPLQVKTKFDKGIELAEYICKLIRLKIPTSVVIMGIDDGSENEGKALLSIPLNEHGQSIIAPYSLIRGEAPLVAAPIQWEDIRDGLPQSGLNYDTVFKRLKKIGDPFEKLLIKRMDAALAIKLIKAHYLFLLQ